MLLRLEAKKGVGYRYRTLETTVGIHIGATDVRNGQRRRYFLSLSIAASEMSLRGQTRTERDKIRPSCQPTFVPTAPYSAVTDRTTTVVLTGSFLCIFGCALCFEPFITSEYRPLKCEAEHAGRHALLEAPTQPNRYSQPKPKQDG
jgi:hypothetical protein